jgi:hypothetical protein
MLAATSRGESLSAMTTAVSAAPPVPALGEDVVRIVRWALLGAAAGALAGLLVGGIGGRLAMFVLRVTSDDSVRGIESDDGFTIGEFSASTGFLLAVTTVIGAAAGLVYVAARSFLPPHLRVWGFTVAAGLVGATLLIQADGVDFIVLEPQWLAVAFFVAIPVGGAALMATWVESWSSRWWWRDRRRTIVASLPAVVGLAFIPLLVIAVVVGAVAVFLGRSPELRRMADQPPIRAFSTVVLALVTTAGAVGLAFDMRDVLG